MDMSKTILKRIFVLVATSVLIFISGCGIDIDNSLPGVPQDGRYAAVGANQHSGINSIQVAIAIFDNGDPVKLVGGDVVQASTANNSVLLLDRGFYTGSYAASLSNEANLNQIDFLMVHEPLEARQGRWFPSDLFTIDPGPGEFVGASASIVLPPEPVNVALSDTSLNNINQSFAISWTAEAAGDLMKVRSAISCSNGATTYTYGTTASLLDETDDGSETIGLDQFIYDSDDIIFSVDFLFGESRALLQKLLVLSNEILPDNIFFQEIPTINPVENPCEIQLFLFRERNGSFDSAVNGRIIGSRSADVTLFYNPN